MRSLRLMVAGLLIGPALCGADPAPDSWDRAVHFADSLMRQHRFRESELEYERLLATHPDHPDRLKVLQKMFDAALATNDYAFTLTLARAWERDPEASTVCLSFLFEQRALYLLANYPAVIKQALPPACASGIANENQQLRGVSRLQLAQWPEARQEFDQIPATSDLSDKARLGSQKSQWGAQLPHKSPALAAGLNAIVPGAGYVYANRPETGAACLLINGLFIWGTVASVHAKQPGLAALLSLFSFGWYWGGVYGSAQAAQKENQARLAAFIEPLELNH